MSNIILIPKGRGNKILLIISAIGYLTYYLFFTGIVQVDIITGYSILGLYLKLVSISSATYSGPAFQIINSSSVITIRSLPFLLSLFLSIAFGLNVTLMCVLYRLRGFKACLYAGGAGGIGTIIANLASFSYLCCGWAASLALIGSTFLATLSPLITLGAAALLMFNAFLLGKRYSLITAKSLI
ncbi:MAG: hypothetical protein QXX95_00355 [Nitrososphaerales archaeon]